MIYELRCSDGTKIKIDDEDLKKIESHNDAFMLRLKQGIVRPPFITSILPTKEKEFKELMEYEKTESGTMRRVGRGKVRAIRDLMGAYSDRKRLE